MGAAHGPVKLCLRPAREFLNTFNLCPRLRTFPAVTVEDNFLKVIWWTSQAQLNFVNTLSCNGICAYYTGNRCVGKFTVGGVRIIRPGRLHHFSSFSSKYVVKLIICTSTLQSWFYSMTFVVFPNKCQWQRNRANLSLTFSNSPNVM